MHVHETVVSSKRVVVFSWLLLLLLLFLVVVIFLLLSVSVGTGLWLFERMLGKRTVLK